MAQPLPNLNAGMDDHNHDSYDTVNGIDASATRLDHAFRRLEAAAGNTSIRFASLRAEQEKLNHLLREREQDAAAMREAVAHVNGRLDLTIATLEAMEQ